MAETALKVDLAPYWRALGEFIHQFAATESIFQWALRGEAGVSDKVGRAVFSGTRAEAARQYMRRIWEANGKKPPPILERAFDQMAILTAARNDIVHFGALPNAEQELIVSNRYFAHADRTLRESAISPSILNEMIEDIHTIKFCILSHVFTYYGEKLAPSREAFRELGMRPWRYKPPQPSGKGQGLSIPLQSIRPRLTHLRGDCYFSAGLSRRIMTPLLCHVHSSPSRGRALVGRGRRG
jgi:hypothetical protein